MRVFNWTTLKDFKLSRRLLLRTQMTYQIALVVECVLEIAEGVHVHAKVLAIIVRLYVMQTYSQGLV